MSFQNQSGDLSSFVEVVPEAAKMTQLSRSSLLTQRRRVRITPQTGSSSGASQQIQFLLSDGGGMLDLRSVVINYTQLVAGTGNVCPDDGHPFVTAQALLNGQLLENQQNACKVANAEMTMGGSKSYYQTAGSFQGFELLNSDLVATAPTTTAVTVATNPAYGYVSGNVASQSARYKRAANPIWNGTAGTQRSVPLGLIMGLGRCKTYLPLALMGEMSFVLQTGSNADVLFDPSSGTDGTYTLSNISLECDIVIPDARYMQLLQKVAGEDGGMTIPYESTIVAQGGVFGSATPATSLSETSIITSRATNHLVRSSVVFIPSLQTSSGNYPSQSAFAHAGLFGFQTRIGSQVFPQIAAQGDASIFNTSLAAYGSPVQENGSVTNRCLWANSTNGGTAGTAANFEDAVGTTSTATRFAYADRCVPSYGYRIVKGGSEDLEVDGVSLAGASGSQLVTTIVAAPQAAYVPYVLMTALRFIKASGGAVSVIGA